MIQIHQKKQKLYAWLSFNSVISHCLIQNIASNIMCYH